MRRIGSENLEAAEDAVQFALLKALETWTTAGVPDNPSAWLYRVARNALLGELRQHSDRQRLLARYRPPAQGVAHSGVRDSVASGVDRGVPGGCNGGWNGVLPGSWNGSWNSGVQDEPEHRLSGELSDELLLMLFACCEDAIPEDSQLVFALKILCGFSVREIAQRLFTSEANVYKRFGRARSRLREVPAPLGELCDTQYAARLPAVQKMLYMLFTEGYLSCHVSQPIREELCQEAIRLGTLLANHPAGRHPNTHALLALMHFHVARLPAREDASGGLLLLEEQNRLLWDQQGIQTGLMWLARSAEGSEFSRYHAEAGIAAEHALAPSFYETRWQRIVEIYDLLEQLAPSALHRLNCAVSVAQWRGPRAGLAVLQGIEPPTWLEGSYQWLAVLADLHLRCGDEDRGAQLSAQALDLAPTDAVKRLLRHRLENSTRFPGNSEPY